MAKYIEREAFVEWMKRIPLKDLSDGLGLCRVIMEEDFKRAIRTIPAGMIIDVAPVQEWIPVDDRFPEEKATCIVHYKHAYCDNDDYWEIGICFYDGEKFRIGCAYKVTHWMPLPQPPADKSN